MAQIITQQYAGNTQTAELKFAQAAYFSKSKISNALSVMKQKVSEWTSKFSSGSSSLASSIMIQDARDRVSIKKVDATEYRRLLAVF